ncbi:MAG: NAD(P)/FAD-dependent oxidoreductase, partial [Anaerolineae bacterium]
MSDFDVIIVGGRPSGSTLAARLGQAGLKVLLLERSTLPSLPAASCPIIYASTMHLLDEIGADESAYARGTPKLRKMSNVLGDMAIDMPIPGVSGRDYAYAIDRARFDAALWDTALRSPTVEGRMGFSAVDLLRDGDRVIGVTGHRADRVMQSFTADLVVGADGRHSFVGRKANAAVTDEHDEYPTSLYYAYWKNAAPLNDGVPQVVALGNGDGYGILMMDSADGTLALGIEGRTERIEPDESTSIRENYLKLIREFPLVWKRVQQAEMIGDVRGIKNVGNLYRVPGGEGWAL